MCVFVCEATFVLWKLNILVAVTRQILGSMSLVLAEYYQALILTLILITDTRLYSPPTDQKPQVSTI